ncbi:MAG: grasp-with-spasm system SPASM domain peptide maturase [Cyclobacteriaceae bacterium]|nr:grasp-with-spasm system SPASM domain peptide maturase [Cyclobacteriaceae bacterium]
MDYSKYLILFSCCIPVKGARRSLICDLGNERYDFIPNALYEILTYSREKTLGELKEMVGSENQIYFKEYIDFLIVNEYCFLTDEPELFPNLELDCKSPNQITNCIVDSTEFSNHDFNLISKELDSVGCIALQLRFFYSPDLEYLESLLANFQESRLRSIEVLIKWSPFYKTEKLVDLVKANVRISHLFLTSSPKNNVHGPIDHSRKECIFFVQQEVSSSACCGFVKESNFITNISIFTESKNFNSCLNRKIGIDIYGNVKNCPASIESFGVLKPNIIKKIIENQEFKRVWLITKDHIDICKDCEFRYICTDCRVFIQNKQDLFSKPSKCDYNPYKALWA